MSLKPQGVARDIEPLNSDKGMSDVEALHRSDALRLERNAIAIVSATGLRLDVFAVNTRIDLTGVAGPRCIGTRLDCREVAGPIALDRVVGGVSGAVKQEKNRQDREHA